MTCTGLIARGKQANPQAFVARTHRIVVLEGAGREHKSPSRRNGAAVGARVVDERAIADAQITGGAESRAPRLLRKKGDAFQMTCFLSLEASGLQNAFRLGCWTELTSPYVRLQTSGQRKDCREIDCPIVNNGIRLKRTSWVEKREGFGMTPDCVVLKCCKVHSENLV